MAVPVKNKTSTLRRVASITLLVLLVGAFLLMFHKPVPIAPPLNPAELAANAEQFQQKLSSLAPAAATPNEDGSTTAPPESPGEIHLTTQEVQAALAQANGPAESSSPSAASAPSLQTSSGEQVTLSSAAPLVTFENDLVKGQFQAELAGKSVVVTVAGHLGQKDGYATFDPTAFMIGGLAVPVSLVNDALQKKMLEQRDRLKLPDFISDIAVQNGELVIKKK